MDAEFSLVVGWEPKNHVEVLPDILEQILVEPGGHGGKRALGLVCKANYQDVVGCWQNGAVVSEVVGKFDNLSPELELDVPGIMWPEIPEKGVSIVPILIKLDRKLLVFGGQAFAVSRRPIERLVESEIETLNPVDPPEHILPPSLGGRSLKKFEQITGLRGAHCDR